MRKEIKAYIEVQDLRQRRTLAKRLEEKGFVRNESSIEERAGWFIIDGSTYIQTNKRGKDAYTKDNEDSINVASVVGDKILILPAFVRLVDADDSDPIGKEVVIKIDLFSFSICDFLRAKDVVTLTLPLFAELDKSMHETF